MTIMIAVAYMLVLLLYVSVYCWWSDRNARRIHARAK
jgi:hypothetical protein